MVGILLALQVNNWNEERKGKLDVLFYCQGIVSDLNSDVESLFNLSQRNHSIDSIGKYVWSYLNNELKEIDTNTLRRGFLFAAALREFTSRRNSYDDLVGQGIIHFMKNDTLKEALANYYKRDESYQINLTQRKRYIDEYNDLRFRFMNPMMLRDVIGNIFNIVEKDAQSIDTYKIDWNLLQNDKEYEIALGKILSQRTFVRQTTNDLKEEINNLLELLNKEIGK
jgi:hypothetical protein